MEKINYIKPVIKKTPPVGENGHIEINIADNKHN